MPFNMLIIGTFLFLLFLKIIIPVTKKVTNAHLGQQVNTNIRNMLKMNQILLKYIIYDTI